MSINNNNNLLNEILSTIDDLPTSKEEQEKSTTIIENGTTEVIPDENKTLSKVTVNVEVPDKSAELENLIDESGVLDSIEGTAIEKVEQLIEKAQSGGGEAEGIQFLEFDDVFYRLPSVAKLVHDYRSNTGEDTYNYAFANNNGYKGLFSRLREVYIPEKITWISNYMFTKCQLLEAIRSDLSNIEHIGLNAFEGCVSLTEFPYLPSVTDIRPTAFKNCTGLTVVKFYSMLSVAASNNMFSGCINITDIYVPWAEGEIANAPWGATNATIHYNTTYDENHEPIIAEV